MNVCCLDTGDLLNWDIYIVAYYIEPVHLINYCFNLSASLILVLFPYICIS